MGSISSDAVELAALLRWEELRALLLPHWRDTRDGALGALLDRISQRLEVNENAEWPATPKADAFGRLLAGLKGFRAMTAPGPERRRLGTFLSMLAEIESDPVPARVALKLWRTWNGESQELAELPAMFVKHADDAVIAEMLALDAAKQLVNRKLVGNIKARLKKLPKTRPGLDSELLAALPKIAELLEAPPKEDEAAERLRAAVYAAPDDEALKRVLQDRLSELADPEAELFALQLPGGPITPQESKLLTRHGAVWAQRLGKAFDPASVEFQTGVPVFARALPGFVTAPTEASWSTLRAIELPHLEAEQFRRAAERLNSLPRLISLTIDARNRTQLPRLKFITHLALRLGNAAPGGWSPQLVKQMLERVQSLEVLEVPAHELEMAIDLVKPKGLRTLAVQLPPIVLAELRAEGVLEVEVSYSALGRLNEVQSCPEASELLRRLSPLKPAVARLRIDKEAMAWRKELELGLLKARKNEVSEAPAEAPPWVGKEQIRWWPLALRRRRAAPQ